MGIAVQIDEESLVRQAVETIEPPAGVRLRRINPYYVDSTGDNAMQIVFSVSTRIPLTKSRVVELANFDRAVGEKISSLGLLKWPFVNMIETR